MTGIIWHKCAVVSVYLFFIALFSACVTVRVYDQATQPEFYFNNTVPDTQHPGTVNVVTFNIKKGQNIAEAAGELLQYNKLTAIDICLLQEMDELGVATIAHRLGLNYLYIPSVYNRLLKKNIGNAILTSGSIEHPVKLTLPHKKWLSRWRRNIAIGEVYIHGQKILVMCVHRETIMMSKKNRMDQVQAVIEYARLQMHDYKYILAGGDFNTLFPADARRITANFNACGFNCATCELGSTARAFFGLVKPRMDYLFVSGFSALRAWKDSTSRSSDHYPVFATYAF